MTTDKNCYGNDISITGENNTVSDNVIVNIHRKTDRQLIELKKIIARQNAMIRKLLLIINSSINERSP